MNVLQADQAKPFEIHVCGSLSKDGYNKRGKRYMKFSFLSQDASISVSAQLLVNLNMRFFIQLQFYEGKTSYASANQPKLAYLSTEIDRASLGGFGVLHYQWLLLHSLLLHEAIAIQQQRMSRS
jgi:hypothetical protein